MSPQNSRDTLVDSTTRVIQESDNETKVEEGKYVAKDMKFEGIANGCRNLTRYKCYLFAAIDFDNMGSRLGQGSRERKEKKGKTSFHMEVYREAQYN